MQPPVDPREEVRAAQAAAVAGFVRELRAAAPDAKVLVVGDLNAFADSPALDALADGAGLVDLAEAKLPPVERYGYVFDGNAQDLDHALVPHDLAGAAAIEIVHLNAGYVDRSSDHDPSVVRLALEDRPEGTHRRRRRHRLRLAGLFALLALLFGFPGVFG
jgi:predicted extracellular nuclease